MRIPRGFPAALLAVLICSNIIALPDHMKVLRNGHTGGYIAAAPFIRAQLVSLSQIPARPALPYDAKYASESEIIFYSYDPKKDMAANVKNYIILSPILNFLRSQKGLTYYQWQVDKEIIWRKTFSLE
jgi:hypothetical protein